MQSAEITLNNQPDSVIEELNRNLLVLSIDEVGLVLTIKFRISKDFDLSSQEDWEGLFGVGFLCEDDVLVHNIKGDFIGVLENSVVFDSKTAILSRSVTVRYRKRR